MCRIASWHQCASAFALNLRVSFLVSTSTNWSFIWSLWLCNWNYKTPYFRLLSTLLFPSQTLYFIIADIGLKFLFTYIVRTKTSTDPGNWPRYLRTARGVARTPEPPVDHWWSHATWNNHDEDCFIFTQCRRRRLYLWRSQVPGDGP